MRRLTRQAMREKFRWAVMSPERRAEVIRSMQERATRSRHKGTDRGFSWKEK
jgi:predicted Fe-S protein YdhL (DUF1289 family)